MRLESDVVDAAVVFVLQETFHAARADMHQRVVIQVQPDAGVGKIRPRPFFKAKNFAVKFFDGGQITRCAADVEVVDAVDFHLNSPAVMG